MKCVHNAAITSQAALMVSPRLSATIPNATAPSAAMPAHRSFDLMPLLRVAESVLIRPSWGFDRDREELDRPPLLRELRGGYSDNLADLPATVASLMQINEIVFPRTRQGRLPRYPLQK